MTQRGKANISLKWPDRAAILNSISISPTYFRVPASIKLEFLWCEKRRVHIALIKMAKAKSGVPNKSLHSRVSYLYQAAAYLASQKPQQKDPEIGEPLTASRQCSDVSTKANHAAARHLVKDLRAVSQKLLMRISPAMKHSMCKSCDTMLVEGSTCTSEVENWSKGGKKPWADVLVLKCTVCGSARRFPVGATRQKRRPHRAAERIDANGFGAG